MSTFNEKCDDILCVVPSDVLRWGSSSAVQYFSAICHAISVAELSDMNTIIIVEILWLIWRWFWPQRTAIDIVCSIAVIWAI